MSKDAQFREVANACHRARTTLQKEELSRPIKSSGAFLYLGALRNGGACPSGRSSRGLWRGNAACLRFSFGIQIDLRVEIDLKGVLNLIDFPDTVFEVLDTSPKRPSDIREFLRTKNEQSDGQDCDKLDHSHSVRPPRAAPTAALLLNDPIPRQSAGQRKAARKRISLIQLTVNGMVGLELEA